MLHATTASDEPKNSFTQPLTVNKHTSNVAQRNGKAMYAVELQLQLSYG